MSTPSWKCTPSKHAFPYSREQIFLQIKKAESSILPWHMLLCLISAGMQTKIITEALEQAPHPPVCWIPSFSGILQKKSYHETKIHLTSKTALSCSICTCFFINLISESRTQIWESYSKCYDSLSKKNNLWGETNHQSSLVFLLHKLKQVFPVLLSLKTTGRSLYCSIIYL